MQVDYRAIGQRIARKRKEQRKTQDQLAEVLGVSIGYVSQIERGVTKISLDTLSQISGALGCQLTELLDGANPHQAHYLDAELAQYWRRMAPSQRNLLVKMARLIAEESPPEGAP